LRDYRRIRVPAGALPAAALITTDGPPGTAPRHRRFTAIRAAAWGISGQEPKGAIITAGTTSRTAHLLAVMKKGDDLHPGPPGHCRESATRTGARGSCRGYCRTRWLPARITQPA